MQKLCGLMALFRDDFLSHETQLKVSVFHSVGDSGSQNIQGLPNDASRILAVSFQQTAENLKETSVLEKKIR